MATKSQTQFDKLRFFKDLNYQPHPGQLKVHLSKATRRILACGVRWGKSTAAAMEGLAAAMAPNERSFGWVAAASYDLASKVFREIILIAAEKLRHRIITIKESEHKIVLRNLSGGISEIRGKSCDNPISLLGEGLTWLIIDEASRLKAEIWQGHLTQRLIDRRGWALLISTPRGKNWFYDLFRRGQGNDSQYESWNSPSWDNPHLDRSLIEQERERLPERLFQQEFEGRFVEGAGAVFRGIRDIATGEWQEPVPGETYFAGLDLGKIADFSVLVIMNRRREVVFVDRFNRLDWNLQINRVKSAVKKYNNCWLLIDSTGNGEPIFEAFLRAGIGCEGYAFTLKSKTALIDQLQILFEKRLITLPKPELWPEGVEELEAYEFSVSDAGNIKMGSPGGAHDDCVIAVALAAWHLGFIEGPEQDPREIMSALRIDPDRFETPLFPSIFRLG